MIYEIRGLEFALVKVKFFYCCCGNCRHLTLVEVLVVELMIKWDLSLES